MRPQHKYSKQGCIFRVKLFVDRIISMNHMKDRQQSKTPKKQKPDFQISDIQTQDIGRTISMSRNIQQRLRKKQPVDQSQEKLESFVAQSKQKTETIRSSIGSIQLQSDLPIAAKADEIKRLLSDNQVVIVAGETGCGKTTQLPKICLQAGFGARGIIGHTQPRRVAATSVAKRIADEVNNELGGLIGYSIRFNNKLSKNTRVKIMTDGVLLTEIESDPLLSRYEVIIIDEAHERSLNIDFLLGFLKRVLDKRKDLKLIITSATIDPQRFSENFNQAPVVLVEGRSYPVEVRYRPITNDDSSQSGDDLMNSIIASVDECGSESTGNILIFADGEGQIKSITKQLAKSDLDNTEILPLYARLGIKEQQKIFASSSKRKIIVSTNVAETSLTVPGIIYVIDIGTARISRFSQRNKIQQLPVEKVSKASADQRKGRCGRVAPGVCIRLYSEEDYELREEYTAPEIKRTNLSSVVLRLKAMNVKQVEDFPFMEQPDDRAWKVAFNSLFELAAIDQQQQITKIGLEMARLPVDPQLARILVEPSLTAVNEMLIFCALMSVREVRERPHDKQKKADEAHRQYNQSDSDVLTAINLWNYLEDKKTELSSNGFKNWCRANFINFLGLLEWRRVYFQLKESLQLLSKKINSSPVHADEVHRALVPGFITHIFYKSQEVYFQGVRGLKVWIHPSSLSFKKSKNWLLSAEMIETEKLYARMNAPINPEWVEQSAPHLLKSHYQDIHWRKTKGQVTALLNQTLLGLPIVNKRMVNYSNVDKKVSRNLFLKDGLALDQLNEDFPFLRSNRQKLKQLEEQEQRQRLNNIRIDAQLLAELYDEVIPENILSFISLKRWLKKDFKARNQLLSFDVNQLMHNQSSRQEDFPSKILVKGVELNLSYCFAPGSSEDGVSVEIPKTMVNQFNDRDFDWLVPGYLEDKILASIKVLPKSIRRSLIPLAETAQKCYEELVSTEQTGKRFIDELARVLQRQSGMQIKQSDFDLDSLEPHLTMKYKVLDKKHSGHFESLTAIKSNNNVSKSRPNKKGEQYLDDWPMDIFELEVTKVQGKIASRVFQGLFDDAGRVAVRNFPSKTICENQHLHGSARLLLLKKKTSLNKFLNSWPDKNNLERLNLRAGGFKSIGESLALGVAKEFIGSKHPLSYKSDFEAISKAFDKGFRERLSQRLNAIVSVLKQRESIYLLLSELNEKAFKSSIEDIRSQLASLWRQETLLMAGESVFDGYRRYQDAISARIKRIQTNYPKEQQAMDIWVDWREWWQECYQHPNIEELGTERAQLYWMLQEFRISLFSPGVKVIGGVSAKKLQSKFVEFEEALDQI